VVELTHPVIAGPAGHWYTLWSDWQFGETLIGLPMYANEVEPPPAPATVDELVKTGWYEITDPAPGCDDEALRAEIKAGA
jgi:hypothetical protein